MTEVQTSPSENARTGGSSVTSVASIVALATSSISPFFSFYAANASVIASFDRLLGYAAYAFAAAIMITMVVKWSFPKLAFWQVASTAGLGIYCTFAYEAVMLFLYGPRTTPFELSAALVIWFCAFTLVLLAGVRIFKSSGAVLSFAAIGVLVQFVPAATLLAHRTSSGSPDVATINSVAAGRARITPNIYWIILDGYPRADVLAGDFGGDNSEFLRELAARQFVVASMSSANYPVTDYSIASTLMMDYLATPEGKLPPMGDTYPIIRGNSPVTRALSDFGYRYVHFENGHSHSQMCGVAQPNCVSGNKSFDEVSIRLAGNTPALDIFSLLWSATAADLSKNVEPDRRSPFHWGGVDALDEKLPQIWEVQSPFFVYAHLIVPHPPFRYDRYCNYRQGRPDLQDWSPMGRSAFLDQIVCANRQTVALIDRVLARDPDAIIILQSDHGPAFRGQFSRAVADWDVADIRERFGVLNAVRFPAGCRPLFSATLSLVNTFPLVLSCIGEKPVEFRKDRFFVTPYNDSKEYRISREVSITQDGPPP